MCTRQPQGRVIFPLLGNIHDFNSQDPKGGLFDKQRSPKKYRWRSDSSGVWFRSLRHAVMGSTYSIIIPIICGIEVWLWEGDVWWHAC